MFYHSFPRPREGLNSIKKGLLILESFLKYGILLVPERVVYQREKDARQKIPEEYYVIQSRFCLTQIGIRELKAHEKYFGAFHLEFSNDSAYSLGAMPVFYLPRIEPGTSEWSLKKIAANYLYQLYELQGLCQDIQALGGMVENKKDQETIIVESENRMAGKARSYTVNVKQLRDVLDMLSLNMVPNRIESQEGAKNIVAHIDAMLDALKSIGSLFYPTDNDYKGEHKELYNFRQREWRITAGLSVDGKQLDKDVSDEHKELLMAIDSAFYEKEMLYADMVKRRVIEKCTVMPAVLCETGLKPVREFVERIIVPKKALKKAQIIAEENHFDPVRVIDFVTAKKKVPYLG